MGKMYDKTTRAGSMGGQLNYHKVGYDPESSFLRGSSFEHVAAPGRQTSQDHTPTLLQLSCDFIKFE